jgi:kynurenine formamidase
MKVIDLTHPISEATPVYFPWHPKTQVEQTATYDANRCEVRRLSIGTHSGTHIDAPSHVYAGMTTLDQYNPGLWYLDAQVLDFTPREPKKEITKAEVMTKLKHRGVGVLVKTGWDVRFGEADYYATYPPLSNEAAEYFVEMNVPVLASDTPFTLDVHYIMLKHGIPLVTNIKNTAQLKEGMIKLIAAPLLIQGSDGAPARVLAVVEEQ